MNAHDPGGPGAGPLAAPASCVPVTVKPAIVKAALRAPPELACARYVTVPDPVP